MTAPLVEMRDMVKSFGGIKAVDHVTIDLYPGEVVGVLGHNGAGKSVLMKMLSGALQRDSGEIYINGEKATINNPRDARNYQIETIYQYLALADNLDAASNLFLGRELMTRPVLSTTPRWKPRLARSLPASTRTSGASIRLSPVCPAGRGNRWRLLARSISMPRS
jgi:ABC-type sugar transport system ATPase subunit